MIFGRDRGPVTDEDVAEAYPWPEEGVWVRSMMVSTLDGAAAGPDGLSNTISGDADRQVFDAVRRFADAILVGGGTVKAEGYGPLRADPDDTERRRAQGQRPAPVLAVVSGSLDLPLGDDGFAGSEERPLVFTGATPDADRLAAVRERCEVVQSGSDSVDDGWVIDQLVERGLRRIVCEGGPSLLRAVVAADRLDEADLTLSPTFAGTSTTPDTEALPDVSRFELAHLLTADGFVMARYVRRR
ncbi:dihydrofolate reductase family protein [Nocardioides mangrovicus]|nr:dihydrofolate reductase family protein [Nocardioides mangrovicus]